VRTLVLGDIHSNWQALERVVEAAGPVDSILCTGDLVDYGPSPRRCVEWIREHADVVVRGNHDHAVAQLVPAAGNTGLRAVAAEARARQREELGPELLRYLARLPVCATFDLDGRETLMVHGSPRDPLDDYAPSDPDGWRERLCGVTADLALVGHTHAQYALNAERPQGGVATVLNPGSVGQPRDGDPRAAYGLIEDGVCSLHRVEYDPEPTIADLARCGLSAETLETAAALLRTGRRPSGSRPVLRAASPGERPAAPCPG